jgi:hypothetical protein
MIDSAGSITPMVSLKMLHYYHGLGHFRSVFSLLERCIFTRRSWFGSAGLVYAANAMNYNTTESLKPQQLRA